MQWDLLSSTLALWALIVASIATWNSRRALSRSAEISAGLARLSGSLSEVADRAEAPQRLTASQLAELAELSDAIAKGNALLKRINSREVMRERRDSSAAIPVDPAALKDHLRRRAGLVAGRPANHFEGDA